MPIAPYEPQRIEPKWQQFWEDRQTFAARADTSLPKYYCLIEFPYPSGAGLHVGHPRSNTALDIIARKRRMEGFNVLYPIGWDAFGLPTENYAIANHVHPAKVTRDNINHFRAQLKRLGFSFDYAREVDTTDPSYYKWTQWIFLKLYEHGLAYKAQMPINWCPSCKIGLANEEVVAGLCERCGHEVTRRVKTQWMLAITRYAQRLLDGLDTVDFIDRVKAQQRNWIGRSEGCEVDFQVAGTQETLRVYTTRPDTMFGATYMVLSPEHPLLDTLASSIHNREALREYAEQAALKSDFERTELARDKSGLRVEGLSAINPATGQAIPLWVSDYVLMGYGTGAIMAVPGHDQRDWEFARAFDLPIVEVISGGDVSQAAYTDVASGRMVNSGFLNGLPAQEAIEVMSDWLVDQGIAQRKVNFRLRDWVFSRQRYWGEPIPIVHCPRCGQVPLKEEDNTWVLEDLGSTSGTLLNVNVPAGNFDIGSQTYMLRLEGQFKNSRELNDIIVGNSQGKPIYLRDVATVSDTLESRVQENYTNGVRSASIVVQKQSGANTVSIANAVREQLPELEKTLPPDIKLVTVMDSSEYVKVSINSLLETILLALLIVGIIVLFFLGRWRATIIIMVTIPISLIGSFIYLYLTGNTINIISLSALSITIGMVVDDAIVVLENITSHIERGSRPRQAAVYGTEEVSLSVIASTLTIIAVFLPLVFVEGIAGQLFGDQALTIAIAVGVSLLVAVTLIPMLSSLKGRAPLAFPEEPARSQWRQAGTEWSPTAPVADWPGHTVRRETGLLTRTPDAAAALRSPEDVREARV